MRVGVGHQTTVMRDAKAAEGTRAQGVGGVHYAYWGNHRGGGRAGGRPKTDVKVAIGGNRPPRLGGDVVIFEDMREYLVASSEYERQTHITSPNGVLARRQELVNSATQIIVTDEFYDDKPWVDLSEEELIQGLKTYAGVDAQQASDEDFCRQILRMLNMDASCR